MSSSHPLGDRFGGGAPTADPAVAAAQQPPAAAWALALVCLVGQLLLLADVGTTSAGLWTLPSMLLGALLVGWFSAGVLTARTGRLVVVWALFVIVLVGDAFALLDRGAGAAPEWRGAHLVVSVAQVVALAWFCSTPYFRWQRTRPRVPGPSLAPLLGVAVVVGLLGGVTASHEGGVSVRMRLG